MFRFSWGNDHLPNSEWENRDDVLASFYPGFSEYGKLRTISVKDGAIGRQVMINWF